MDLYGQAALAKHLNDSKNIERNYWRVFKELETSKKRVEELEGQVMALTEENKKLKSTSKAKTAKKKVVEPEVLEDTSEELV